MTRSASRRDRAAQEKAQRRLEREQVVLSFDYHPGVLLYEGPVIVTDLRIAGSQEEALKKAGLPIPAAVRCRFLIDTGADTTVVKHEFAERAGLKMINDNAPLHGIGVDTTGRSYIGRLLFACESRTVTGAMIGCYVDTQISAATLPTDRIDGLIGRDVLRHFILSYDGKTGQIRMRYHRPTD